MFVSRGRGARVRSGEWRMRDERRCVTGIVCGEDTTRDGCER